MTDILERTEVIAPAPGLALAGLLGVQAPDLAADEPLPIPWHWVYLLERPAQADLGPDGHPARGGIPVPPGPGRRRMWASGTVTGLGPLRCGRPATRRTQVLGSQDKEGRSGRMTFVTVGHEIVQDGAVVVREEQHIVYRDAAPPVGGAAGAASEGSSGMPQAPAVTPDPSVPSVPAVPIGPAEWDVVVDPTLLFRYSALTYNAHRIHYDRDFARDVEGYPGLVVHGPLQATLMAEAARRRGLVEPGRPVQLAYRMQSPLFDHQGLVVSAVPGPDGVTTSVRDRWGRVTATGTLRLPS